MYMTVCAAIAQHRLIVHDWDIKARLGTVLKMSPQCGSKISDAIAISQTSHAAQLEYRIGRTRWSI